MARHLPGDLADDDGQLLKMTTMTISIPTSISFCEDEFMNNWEECIRHVRPKNGFKTLAVGGGKSKCHVSLRPSFKNCVNFHMFAHNRRFGVKVFDSVVHVTGARSEAHIATITKHTQMLFEEKLDGYISFEDYVIVNMAKWDFDTFLCDHSTRLNLDVCARAICVPGALPCTVSTMYDPSQYSGINIKVPLKEVYSTGKRRHDLSELIEKEQENYTKFRQDSKIYMDSDARKIACKKMRDNIKKLKRNNEALLTILLWASGKATLVVPWACMEPDIYADFQKGVLQLISTMKCLIRKTKNTLILEKVIVVCGGKKKKQKT